MKVKKKRVQGWDLWKHGVTQSFLGSFLACREQTRLKYEERWRVRGSSKPIEFGNCVHWVLGQLYSVKGKKDTRKQLKLLINKYARIWTKENPLSLAPQLQQQEMIYGLTLEVLERYIAYWKKEDKQANWVMLEEVFNIPYVYPDGKQTLITGRVDGAYKRKAELWLFETKSKGTIDEDGIIDSLPLDLQVNLYLYVLSFIFNRMPTGVCYNLIRRPQQRLLKDEALKVYIDRCAKDIDKRPEHYFIRLDGRFDKSEIKTWKKTQLDPLMIDVRRWAEHAPGARYINPGSLFTRYGKCDMFYPMTKGDFTNCFRRPFVFSELTD